MDSKTLKTYTKNSNQQLEHKVFKVIKYNLESY